ncbi:MAG: peroxidase-related enzyme [Alphaproteobacteria bacterium]|nr:peroxidase-related enzyme [Alphaproteobacteria bacterium SS10]
MPQPEHVMALDIVPDETSLDDEHQKFFQLCRDKLGFVPNVLQAYSAREAKLRTFSRHYNELMLGDSKLSKLEREMIAVVVSSANHCYYCLVAHGAAVRQLSGDPELGEMLVMNYRTAALDDRQRAMLDFAWKLTTEPHQMGEADREALRQAGFSEEEIFDIADVTGFFNMSNRVASAVEMIPNREYHSAFRSDAE